jgi:hypothetical protein
VSGNGNGNGWRHLSRLRQQGLLTLSIVLAVAVIVGTLLPVLSWRTALIFIAVFALLLGWVP